MIETTTRHNDENSMKLIVEDFYRHITNILYFQTTMKCNTRRSNGLLLNKKKIECVF